MNEPAVCDKNDAGELAACDTCGADLTPTQRMVIAMLWAAGIRRVAKFCEACWRVMPRETARPSFKKVRQRSES